MLKKCKLVMLPSNEKANYNLWINNDKKLLYSKFPYGIGIGQHLYILSDDEIKEGDWVIKNGHTTVYQIENNSNINNCKKIIATTDSSIAMIRPNPRYETVDMVVQYSQPSSSFIEKYIESYNSGNPINEVMVEFEQTHWKGTKLSHEDKFKLKINPKDNTITIKKVKDSWNREEMLSAFEKGYNAGYNNCYTGVGIIGALEAAKNKWIEENL